MARLKESVLRRLFALSGNQCAFPGCTHQIVNEEGDLVADVCHIKAASPRGPRYDSEQTDEERGNIDNLLILCPNHHRKIDNDDYSVDQLVQMKATHSPKSPKLDDRQIESLVRQAVETQNAQSESKVNSAVNRFVIVAGVVLVAASVCVLLIVITTRFTPSPNSQSPPATKPATPIAEPPERTITPDAPVIEPPPVPDPIKKEEVPPPPAFAAIQAEICWLDKSASVSLTPAGDRKYVFEFRGQTKQVSGDSLWQEVAGHLVAHNLALFSARRIQSGLKRDEFRSRLAFFMRTRQLLRTCFVVSGSKSPDRDVAIALSTVGIPSATDNCPSRLSISTALGLKSRLYLAGQFIAPDREDYRALVVNAIGSYKSPRHVEPFLPFTDLESAKSFLLGTLHSSQADELARDSMESDDQRKQKTREVIAEVAQKISNLRQSSSDDAGSEDWSFVNELLIRGSEPLFAYVKREVSRRNFEVHKKVDPNWSTATVKEWTRCATLYAIADIWNRCEYWRDAKTDTLSSESLGCTREDAILLAFCGQIDSDLADQFWGRDLEAITTIVLGEQGVSEDASEGGGSAEVLSDDQLMSLVGYGLMMQMLLESLEENEIVGKGSEVSEGLKSIDMETLQDRLESRLRRSHRLCTDVNNRGRLELSDRKLAKAVFAAPREIPGERSRRLDVLYDIWTNDSGPAFSLMVLTGHALLREHVLESVIRPALPQEPSLCKRLSDLEQEDDKDTEWRLDDRRFNELLLKALAPSKDDAEGSTD